MLGLASTLSGLFRKRSTRAIGVELRKVETRAYATRFHLSILFIIHFCRSLFRQYLYFGRAILRVGSSFSRRVPFFHAVSPSGTTRTWTKNLSKVLFSFTSFINPGHHVSSGVTFE